MNKLVRPSVEALDTILGHEHKVLDHGFVRVVDYMGDDSAIVQAARVSYGSGTKSVRDDRGLIRYLMRHYHSTPFEMCEIKLHVKLPLFVARQWIRHRTANVNEYSARYSILDNEFYIPEPHVMAKQSLTNNQGRGEVLTEADAEKVRQWLIGDSMWNYERYSALTKPTSEGGIDLSREIARTTLPASIYTQWYWKVDLHNLFHFLRLRADSHAQYEIRVYADEICKIVKQWVPAAYEAFEDYQLHAETFSKHEMDIIRHYMQEHIDVDEGSLSDYEVSNSDLSKRELREFLEKLK